MDFIKFIGGLIVDNKETVITFFAVDIIGYLIAKYPGNKAVSVLSYVAGLIKSIFVKKV